MRHPIQRINPAATASEHQRFALVDNELLDQKAADARENTRQRDIHRFHREDSAVLQRMLNALQPGSYIQPHRHLNPPKAEAFVILRGRAGFVFFEGDGSISPDGLVILDPATGPYAVDIRPGVWHAAVALAPDTIVYEVKPGPYSVVDDKDFAPWAPAPGTTEAEAYLKWLETELRKASL